jgi:hypothetical protein
MNSDLQKFVKCDVFTPSNISKIMSKQLKSKGNLLEPSVGIGNLLQYIHLDNYESIDVFELKQEYLSQLPTRSNIHQYHTDFLKTDIQTLYDNIIMNPPYIRIQDLSVSYRIYLKETFDILKDGLLDIYYAFMIKGLKLLKDDGVMVSITPNSYLYNKSSHLLRKYLFENRYVCKIIDFKDEKVFDGVSVYCCITVFTKTDKDYIMYNDKKIPYTNIIKNYSLFNDNDKTKKTLKDVCKIKNGIATLRDKIYIHEKKLYDEPCWKEITNGPIIKYIIYPYDNGIIISEDEFKKKNPFTYKYLISKKEELSKRDKGNKKYPTWYSFGRTQSLRYNQKQCIYISCFLNPNEIQENIFIHNNILHYGCLCIEPKNENDIPKIIKNIINQIDFIGKNSSKRSGGWINMSSRILYDVLFE